MDPQCRCSYCCRKQCVSCSGSGQVLRNVLVGTGLVERWVKCECAWPKERLSARDRQMLEFEEKWWRQAGSKEQAIVTTFDVGVTTYYQALNALLKLPAALAQYPAVVNRLRRIQLATRRRRFGW